MSRDITLAQALERVAAASPDQQTVTLQAKPDELHRLSLEVGVPVATKILGARLASDSLCFSLGWVKFILSAGYRKATPEELRQEAARLTTAAAEHPDAR